MDFDGDGLIQFAVDEEILQNVHDVDDAVSNTGTINADGGTVLLKGKAAKDVFTNVVNNSGIIGASKIQNEGGVIKLVASGQVIHLSIPAHLMFHPPIAMVARLKFMRVIRPLFQKMH